MHINVALVNRSTRVSQAAEAVAAAAALESQAVHHIAVEWGLRAPRVEAFTTEPGPAWWPLVLLDDADQAGALGYHDETPNGEVYGRVFVKTCADHGVSWQSCASHELAEMMGDAHVESWTAKGSTLWATELADPVESNTYRWNGVDLSDFVLPSWFDPRGKPPFSFMDRHRLSGAPGLTQPFQVARGGYSILATAWPKITQVFADGAELPGYANGYPAWRMWKQKLVAGSRSLRRYERQLR